MTQPPAPDTTFLYLVRHGATDANLQRPYVLQGQGIDRALSETGRRQSRAVAKFLEDFAIDRVFSSVMLRAVETARAIAERHRLEVSQLENVSEIDVGDWEGMDWDSIMRDYPDEYRNFMADPVANPYVGGESYGDVLRRVRPVMQRLLEEQVGSTIVVVAHNVVNRVYLSELLGIELRKAKDIRQTNTGINLIRYRRGETELLTLNAHFHLNDLTDCRVDKTHADPPLQNLSLPAFVRRCFKLW